jgi:hypothetical protein
MPNHSAWEEVLADATRQPTHAKHQANLILSQAPVLHLLELESTCAEEATRHRDTSSLILHHSAPHKLGPVTLSDDWLPNLRALPHKIRLFSEEDFPHCSPPAADPAVQAAIKDANRALGLLAALRRGDVPAEIMADPDAFIRDILSAFPDPEAFRAGGWSEAFMVWQHVFYPYRRTRAAVRGMLESIRHGIRWPLRAPASQTAMPDHGKKLTRLRKALSRQMAPAVTDRLLHSPTPHAAAFPNHRSAEQHADFVRSAIADLLTAAVAIKLPEGERPLIINPLGVADNKAPKLRLVVDPLYPNLLFQYEQLRYEQLADLTCYLRETDWACTTDEKSGYYHQALHPSVWTMLGFQFDGAYYVFTHLPFGVGPACRAYTVVKQELYRIVRTLSNGRLTFLIDDTFFAGKDYATAAVLCGATMLLQRALKFTLSLPKCHPFPAQQQTFLGMQADIPNLRFLLPQQKIDDFCTAVTLLADSPTTTDRTLARLAGKLVSFAPAIGLAPLYAHQLFKIMQGQASWDTLYDTPHAAVEAMQWVAANLTDWNGHTWASKRETLVVAGDYSSTHGYAAYTPNGEIEEPIVITHTPEELALIAANKHSSTLGEAKTVELSLSVLVENHLALVKGRRLLYNGDSQPCIQSMATMSGCAAVYPTVRRTYELALKADVELAFIWHPREEQMQQWADHWSKVVDNSQWMLNDLIFHECIDTHPLVTSLGGITLDPFADHLTSKCKRFYSRHWCPGTLGVNGINHPWALNQITGARELCYVNGDFSRMGEILNKILTERANCVVVYPDWPRYWQALWADLPVRSVITLPRINDLCIPGPRVDRRKRRGLPPKYPLKVAFVIWD